MDRRLNRFVGKRRMRIACNEPAIVNPNSNNSIVFRTCGKTVRTINLLSDRNWKRYFQKTGESKRWSKVCCATCQSSRRQVFTEALITDSTKDLFFPFPRTNLNHRLVRTKPRMKRLEDSALLVFLCVPVVAGHYSSGVDRAHSRQRNPIIGKGAIRSGSQ